MNSPRRWFPDGDYSHLHDPALFASVRAGTDGVCWGSGTAPEVTVRVHSDDLYGLVHGLTAVQMSPELYADHVAEAEPLSKYRVRIRFLDGTEGVIDLSDFAHRGPLFDCWGRARRMGERADQVWNVAVGTGRPV